MRLQIDPPVDDRMFPLDRKTFTVKAPPPPAMWTQVTNSGDIQSDFSLQVDGAEAFVGALSAHSLFSGSGIVEWTIDDQMRPTSSGRFDFTGRIFDSSAFLYLYGVQVSATEIEIFDEGAVKIADLAVTVVSGDVLRLEMSSGFRLYRNGTLLHERVNLPTQVIYPMSFSVGLTEPTATAPSRILAPKLIGKWDIGSFVSFTAPSHGSISATGLATRTDYFGAFTPGKYTLTAQTEAAADANNVQRATATIEIPPLQISGPTEITLQPGEKIRPKTNYDDAQNLLIAWSVVSGGGSFSQGEYTAGTSPGTSVIRATADVNDQVADITITVPAVITNPSSFIAAKPSEQIDFATNIAVSTVPELFSSGSVVGGTGNITPGLPAGMQDHDTLFLPAQTSNQDVPEPTDWDPVADSPQSAGTAGAATSTRLSMFWRRWAPGMAAPSITDPGDHVIAQIVAVRGCPFTGNPWDVTAGDALFIGSTSVSIPGDTTTVDNCLILAAVAHGIDSPNVQASGFANGSLTSVAERGDACTDQNNGGGFAYATGIKASAGAYSATTCTLAASAIQGRISVALKPGGILWSASAGSINSSTGVWDAPSLPGQTVKIKATNGFFTVILEVPVLDVFPIANPILPVSWDRNLNSLVSMSEDRKKRITRDKALPFDSYPVKFAAITLAQSNTVDAFFDEHGFGKLFILEDPLRGVRKVGWFDSKIAHEARDECDIDIAFQFLEARF